MTRRILIPIFVTLLCWGVYATRNIDSETGAPVHLVTVSCQEDEPCWDCHTMGNKICGPGHG